MVPAAVTFDASPTTPPPSTSRAVVGPGGVVDDIMADMLLEARAKGVMEVADDCDSDSVEEEGVVEEREDGGGWR